jgi:hypothetical protein
LKESGGGSLNECFFAGAGVQDFDTAGCEIVHVVWKVLVEPLGEIICKWLIYIAGQDEDVRVKKVDSGCCGIAKMIGDEVADGEGVGIPAADGFGQFFEGLFGGADGGESPAESGFSEVGCLEQHFFEKCGA